MADLASQVGGIYIPDTPTKKTGYNPKMSQEEIKARKKELRKRLEGIENNNYRYRQQNEYNALFTEENLNNKYGHIPERKPLTANQRYTNQQRSRSINDVWDEAHEMNARGDALGVKKGLTQNQYDAMNNGYQSRTPAGQRRMNYINQKKNEKQEYINKANERRKNYMYDDGSVTDAAWDEAHTTNKLITRQNELKNNKFAFQSLEDKESAIKELANMDDMLAENGSLSTRQLQKKNIIEAKLGVPKNSGIPTESNIRKQAVKNAQEEAVESASKAVKTNADDIAKSITKSKVGRIIAGVGVGAVIVSNMNKNKGQQSNGQLYGQQTPYSY